MSPRECAADSAKDRGRASHDQTRGGDYDFGRQRQRFPANLSRVTPMNRTSFRLMRGSRLACLACLASAFVGCGGNNSSQFKNGGGSGSPALSGNGGGVLSGSSSGGLGGGSGASGGVFSADGGTGIYA